MVGSTTIRAFGPGGIALVKLHYSKGGLDGTGALTGTRARGHRESMIAMVFLRVGLHGQLQ